MLGVFVLVLEINTLIRMKTFSNNPEVLEIKILNLVDWFENGE